MAQSDISLCSKALVKLGANSITFFYENTAEAQVAHQLYTCVRDALLSSYPWRFATAQVSLSRLANFNAVDYSYAYQLPNDFLRALSAGCGQGKGLNYRIYQRTLQTNSPNIILTYLFLPKEENFPAFFDELLIAKLAAEFCLPLTESTTRTEFLIKQANNIFAQAKLVDSQQSLPESIIDFPLIEVRL